MKFHKRSIKKFFITGTDTSVGKTLFCSILMDKFLYDYWKPIQTGNKNDNDTIYIKKICKIPSNRFYKPAFSFRKSLSPHQAAKYENVSINLNNIKKPITNNPLIIEGIGGILVPLNNKNLIIDLIKKLKFPVIIVSRSTLGTINHTLMTIKILRQNKIKIYGVVLNGVMNKKNAQSIEHFGKVKVLAQIPFFKKISLKKIKNFTNQNPLKIFKP
jgi:dethiobiotin synthase